jgi:hypothetical protein
MTCVVVFGRVSISGTCHEVSETLLNAKSLVLSNYWVPRGLREKSASRKISVRLESRMRRPSGVFRPDLYDGIPHPTEQRTDSRTKRFDCERRKTGPSTVMTGTIRRTVQISPCVFSTTNTRPGCPLIDLSPMLIGRFHRSALGISRNDWRSTFHTLFRFLKHSRSQLRRMRSWLTPDSRHNPG